MNRDQAKYGLPSSGIPILTNKFTLALDYATIVHAAQVRKGTNIPYISHLLAVASLVLENGGDESLAIAGLLHDAAEDQGGEPRLADIRVRFGERVADISGSAAIRSRRTRTPRRPGGSGSGNTRASPPVN
jgi:(p)ppGpp synthase/HD superfamily hydrolase